MNWKIEGCIAEGGFHVVKIDGAKMAMSIADPGGHIAHEATIPIVTLCQLFSASEDGRQAMCEALTKFGWVCCPPGTASVFVEADENGDPAERGGIAVAYVFDNIVCASSDRLIRYIRAQENP